MPSFTISSSQVFDDLAHHRAATRSSPTLLAATEAFLATPLHDKRSKQKYSELFRHFLPKTSLPDRQRIARLIAKSLEAPKAVLLLLCCDEESIACHVLRHSPNLDQETLTTQILQGTTSKRIAIASRQEMTSMLASHLISFGEEDVLVNLEQHIDKLPEIAERLHDILGDESKMAALEKEIAMEPKEQDYDKLVADMERDWYEHYQPEKLASAEKRMMDAADDVLASALKKMPEDSPAISEPLSELDHAQDAAPKRFSFSILAEDDDNATIPPLESTIDDERSPGIHFKGLKQESSTGESLSDASDMAVSSVVKDHDNSDAVAEIDTDENVKASVASEEKPQTAAGRITFEIRAEKEKAPQTSSKKVRPLSEIALIHEADEMEEMQLGPAPAPFVPRNIPQNLSDKDWETALAHLAKPVEDLPVERLGMNANTRSPAQISKPPVRQRVGLAQIAPSVKAPSKPLSQDHKMIVTAGTSAEASISFTHVQSAPILLKARSDRSDADQQERLASVSMPTGPRSASKQKPVADLAEQSSAKPKITLTRQPLLSQTEQNKEQKPGLSDVTPLSQLVLRHTLFEPNHHDHCVLKKEDVPHGATIEAFADKPALAKPLLSDLSHLAVEADLPASASADTLDAFVHKASLAKPDISALLSDPDSIERPQLKRGIPAVFQTPYDSETETETETETEKSATILEQASSLSDLGFMPSLIDLEDLELVEAVPDMPSAGQALMDQHAQRATPAIELVEPVDLYFADSEDPQSDFDGEQSPMLVVAAQMEAERGKTTDKLEEQRAQSDVSILRDKMERDAPANPILQVQAEEQARQEASLHHEAAQIHIQVRSSPALDELVNEAGDLTDLPELSHHQIVGAEDLAALKSDASADALETAPMESASLSNERRPAARQTGSMDQFLAFDEETRLAILQSLISTTLPMNRADRFRRWPQGRPQLEEKHSSALLMARFASDTQTVAKVMHEISGHRKSDLIKLLQDPGGEALIAYLATIGLDESRALSMVLHAPDALSHSYDKVSKLMTLFDQMHPAAGLVIVEQLLGSLPQEERISQPKHVPVLDAGHDEKAARLRDNVDQEAQAHERDPMITFGHRTGSDA